MPVYFAATGEVEPPNTVKIGWTERPLQERLNDLQTANHEVLRVIRTVAGNQDLERWFHKRFAAQRLYRRREWFSFHPEMLTALPVPRPRAEPPPMSESEAKMAADLAELAVIFGEHNRRNPSPPATPAEQAAIAAGMEELVQIWARVGTEAA